MIKDKDKYMLLLKKIVKLMAKADLDELIYGNSFFEFTDREIKLLEPEKVITKFSKNGKNKICLKNGNTIETFGDKKQSKLRGKAPIEKFYETYKGIFNDKN